MSILMKHDVLQYKSQRGKENVYVCVPLGAIPCIVRYTHSMTILEYKSVYNVQLEEVIIVRSCFTNHDPSNNADNFR